MILYECEQLHFMLILQFVQKVSSQKQNADTNRKRLESLLASFKKLKPN